MLKITDEITIPADEIAESFIHSTGPGGQNVNKVATAVQLRFNVSDTKVLSDPVKERLIKIAGKKVSGSGDLIITARRYRSQSKNRDDAYNRLRSIILKALDKPRRRIPTRVPTSAKEKRLKAKQIRSGKKKDRKPVDY